MYDLTKKTQTHLELINLNENCGKLRQLDLSGCTTGILGGGVQAPLAGDHSWGVDQVSC